jgi:RNA polymerase sigma-70 factor (ECF subfamily)
MRPTDEQLVAAARDGNHSALERLLDRHQSRVFRFGKRMCGGDDDAQEVLQETLIAAARTLKDFRGASSVSTWLYTIARSFCLKRRRRHPLPVEPFENVQHEAIQVVDERRTPDEQLSSREAERFLLGIIGKLDPKYREVLMLRDAEGLSAAEAAAVLGLSVDAMKSRLHRARVAVRERTGMMVPSAQEDVVRPPVDSACPDILKLFSRYLEDDISAEVCAEMERHLASCGKCRARCDSLRASLRLCRAAGQEEVPPAIAYSVRAAVRRVLDSTS